MKPRITILALSGLFAAALTAFGQAPSPGGAAIQGFSVQTLISEISLFLPDGLVQGAFGFGGRGGAGGGGQANGQAQVQGAGGTTGQVRPQIQFTKDTKLLLTKEQAAKLLPILLDLQKSPMPTPSKARTVQAGVDAILTAAQKAEYVQFQKALEKMVQSFQQMRADAGGTGSGAAAGGFGSGAADQGAQGEQAQGGQQRTQAGRTGGGQQLTPLQRSQREIDGFVKAIQDYQKQLG